MSPESGPFGFSARKRRNRARGAMSRSWTIGKATTAGLAVGLIALLLRIFYSAWPELVRPLLLAACVAAAFCGLSILWITAVDRLRYGRRGERLIPLRAFDVSVALLLTLPSLWMVPSLIDEF